MVMGMARLPQGAVAGNGGQPPPAELPRVHVATRPTRPATRRNVALANALPRHPRQRKFDWTGWKISSLERLSPQQGDDTVNCGVYTLACFWALACGVSLSAIRRQDLTRWRERFLVWLLDGGASLGLSS